MNEVGTARALVQRDESSTLALNCPALALALALAALPLLGVSAPILGPACTLRTFAFFGLLFAALTLSLAS